MPSLAAIANPPNGNFAHSRRHWRVESELGFRGATLAYAFSDKTRGDCLPHLKIPNPLTDPSICLEDTALTFSPASLEEMIEQRNQPVVASGSAL